VKKVKKTPRKQLFLRLHKVLFFFAKINLDPLINFRGNLELGTLKCVQKSEKGASKTFIAETLLAHRIFIMFRNIHAEVELLNDKKDVS
jgi:hypothetical protein